MTVMASDASKVHSRSSEGKGWGIRYHYSTFVHCTNSDFPIGSFVPRDTKL